MLWRSCIVFLFIFITKDGFCGVVRYDRIRRSVIDILANPPLYSLARLPITSINTEPKSESSERVYKKILQPPLAFSYNKQLGEQDLKSSATHSHSDGDGGNKESGGGKSHHEEHYKGDAEKSSKGYKGHHEHEKNEKGHHDKEGHKGSYSDKGGKTQKKFEEDSFHALQQKGSKGEKGNKFEESGKHEKGHSTKGGHSINKKDHYEKNHEFFDEYYEGGDNEKHGAFHAENDYKKGGSKKGSQQKSHHYGAEYGKKGLFDKGSYYDEDLGHKKKAGHDEHHDHVQKYGKKNSKEGGKVWGYKKGDGTKAKVIEALHDNEKYTQEDNGEVDDAVIEKERFIDDSDHSPIKSVSLESIDDTDSLVDAISEAVPLEVKDETDTSNIKKYTVKGPDFSREDEIKETDYVFAKPPHIVFDNGKILKQINNAQALQQPVLPITAACGN